MSKNIVNHCIREEVQAMSAYHIADASNLIKLDAMENPYNWPDEITAQWLETLRHCPINRYPDPVAKELCNRLRQVNSVPDQSALMLGNGSDELIQILLMALPSNASILAPAPSFVMYRQIAQSLGLEYHSIPLQADSFSLDIESMLTHIRQHQPAIIFLAYPNNPTGNLFAEDEIKQILQLSEGLVIVDEAYAPFTNASFMPYLPDYPNLMVMRTLSKLGLAGLRLGFLCGDSSLIDHLDKIRLPYNINSLTQLTARFALDHIEFLNQQTNTIRQHRDAMFNRLNALNGIHALASEANFILLKCQQISATTVFNQLKCRDILIKNLSPQGGLLSDSLRVTVGTASENEAFLSAMAQIVTTPDPSL